MGAAVWDKRYSEAEYAYGEEPNVFIAAAAKEYLTSPCQCAELASGEGRNVWYLAKLGHTVHAVDFSSAGLQKTQALAAKHGCSERVACHQANITSWMPEAGPASLDCVVMSFCHMVPEDKPLVFANICSMLKPGGVLLLETFHPNQIHKGYRAKSGGPHDPDMMFTMEQLRLHLGSCLGSELHAAELEYELHEGKFHEGIGAVTRYVWRKS